MEFFPIHFCLSWTTPSSSPFGMGETKYVNYTGAAGTRKSPQADLHRVVKASDEQNPQVDLLI